MKAYGKNLVIATNLTLLDLLVSAGSLNQLIFQVFSGQYSSDLSKYTEFPPVGFSIDYKIDTGIC